MRSAKGANAEPLRIEASRRNGGNLCRFDRLGFRHGRQDAGQSLRQHALARAGGPMSNKMCINNPVRG